MLVENSIHQLLEFRLGFWLGGLIDGILADVLGHDSLFLHRQSIIKLNHFGRT